MLLLKQRNDRYGWTGTCRDNQADSGRKAVRKTDKMSGRQNNRPRFYSYLTLIIIISLCHGNKGFLSALGGMHNPTLFLCVLFVGFSYG